MNNRKPKIIFWNAFSLIGGSEKVLLILIDSLRNKYQIKVIVPTKGPLEKEITKRGIPVILLPTGAYTKGNKNIKDLFKYVFYTFYVLAIGTKKIRTEKPSLLYVNGVKSLPFAFLIGKITRTPLIGHIHHILEDKKAIKIIEIIGKNPVFKKFIAVSEATKKQFPSISNKTIVVYNGVDTSLFSPHKDNKLNIKKSFGIKEDERILGILARIIPHKGIHIGIGAMKYLNTTPLKIKLLIAGETPPEEEEYKKRLLEMIKKEKIERVEFLPYQEDVSNVFNVLDILLVPSTTLFEGCPMAILEAYSAEIPIIGTNLGGIPELIEEGKTGFICKPNDSQDLAEKTLQIINNYPLYSDMKKQCKKIAIEKFDIRTFLKNINMVLDTVINC
ncbi:MAG: glycosyltransferase family 4 protein [bacterium]|nr:glycosyltransferase family 4 protein [bacterium]